MGVGEKRGAGFVVPLKLISPHLAVAGARPWQEALPKLILLSA